MNHYVWKITRGDTSIKTVTRKNAKGEIVPFTEGEEVHFTVKFNSQTPEFLIHKKVTKFNEFGQATIKICPNDTKNLEYGIYCYDVRLVVPTKKFVKTLVSYSNFHVLSEVTWLSEGDLS